MVVMAYMWLVLVTFGVLFMLSNKGFNSGIFGFILVWGSPALLIIWFLQIRPNKIAKENEEVNRKRVFDLVGSSPRFQHFESSTGIAVNESKGEIILSDAAAGLFKSYPFSAIRGWSLRKETVESGSVRESYENAIMRKDARAARNTGLFLDVKDIDHPEWRVVMKSEIDRNRWFEILKQTINEGGVA